MFVFAAYDATTAPLTGLSPTWHAAFNAVSGAAVTGPAISELGSGLYSFTRPTSYDFTGLIDLTAAASPRYYLVTAERVEVLAAFNVSAVPLTGLTPSWVSLFRVSDSSAVAQPSFTELGSGLYKFPPPYVGEHVTGVIDLGATASPRYSLFEYAVGVGSPVATAPATSPSGPLDREFGRLFGTDIYFENDFVVTSAGDYLLRSGIANLKAAIYRRLITRPGEYKFVPEYGVGIRDYVKKRSNAATIDSLRTAITEQLLRERRIDSVERVALDVTPDAINVGIVIKAAGRALRFRPFQFTEEQ